MTTGKAAPERIVIATTKPELAEGKEGYVCVLYLDGHVAFQRYEEKGEGPINGCFSVATALLDYFTSLQ